MDLSNLNPQQRAAVEQLEGPVLVLAGAGTGKTMVITWRIANLLEHGVDPHQVLAMTFTNKAAHEMRERIAKLLGKSRADGLTVSTFHAFCATIMRRHIHHLGFTSNFGIADDGDQYDLVKDACLELHLDLAEHKPQEFRAAISKFKNDMQGPEAVLASYLPKKQLIASVMRRYQELLQNKNLLDFDDLLLLVLRLWDEQPELLVQYRERFHYILVDEFQDTNLVQAEIVRRLAGTRRNVCVVGDDDQSIYGWRGAAIENILEFPQDYPGAKVIKLEQNYRSTSTILTAANHAIKHNRTRHGKELWSAKPAGESIKIIACRDDQSEAELIAKLLRQANLQLRLPYDDMAVLFRSNHQAEPLEDAVLRQHIPYRLVGAKSYYERREIKDAVAYLRIAHNQRDDLALLRILNVPARGLGDKAFETLKVRQRENRLPMLRILAEPEFQAGLSGPARDKVRQFLEVWEDFRAKFAHPGELGEKVEAYLNLMEYLPGMKRIYKDHDEALERQERVRELIQKARDFETRAGHGMTLQDFLEAFSLADDNDKVEEKDEKNPGVSLMTVHAAKGLEFSYVVVAGLEEDTFPNARSIGERGDADEERRLFYVAVTRARQVLVLTRAARRRIRGEGKNMRPSSFLQELPEDMVQVLTEDGAVRPLDRGQAQDLLSSLRSRYTRS